MLTEKTFLLCGAFFLASFVHAQKMEKPRKDKETGLTYFCSKFSLFTKFEGRKIENLRFRICRTDTGRLFMHFYAEHGGSEYIFVKGDTVQINFTSGAPLKIPAAVVGKHGRGTNSFGYIFRFFNVEYDIDDVIKKKLLENEVESVKFLGTKINSDVGIMFGADKKEKDIIQKTLALFEEKQ